MNKKKIIVISVIVLIILIITIPICLYEYNINKKNDNTILFLGDSLTERYDFKKYFPKHNIINSGIGGNLTTDILNDLDNRVYKYNPDKVFLLIGINDIIYSDLSDDEIKDNVELIIKNIKEKLPNTKIYIESIYPINYKLNNRIYNNTLANKDHNNRIKNINKKVKTICNNKCTYINMYDSLEIFNDKLFRYYTTDGLHINRVGYRLITIKLLKYINE